MKEINQVNFFKMNKIEPMHLNGGISVTPEEINVKSFKDCMSDMMVQLNEVTNKPSELAQKAMQGEADIHTVMAAVAQSELTVQAATTITGKILQTYEKIMQIQI